MKFLLLLLFVEIPKEPLEFFKNKEVAEQVAFQPHTYLLASNILCNDALMVMISLRYLDFDYDTRYIIRAT